MNLKAKGTCAERELIHLFWKNSWAAVRVAGSGSMRYPSPDIIASNNIRKTAIECKACGDSCEYIEKSAIENLRKFALMFGAEPWIAVRFSRQEWFFVSLDDMKDTGKSMAVSMELAKQKGLSFQEFIGNF